MNAVEIEEAVSELAERPFDRAEFPFQFLEAFGNKPATIKRLRDGMKPKQPRKAKPKTGAYHRNYGGLKPMLGMTDDDRRMEAWRRQHRGAKKALAAMGAT